MAAATARATKCTSSLCSSISSSAWNQARVRPGSLFASFCRRNCGTRFGGPIASTSAQQITATPAFGQKHNGGISNRGVRMQAETGTSGSSESLATKRCIPCEGKNVKALDKEAAEELLQEVPGWELVTEGEFKLRREWKTKNFLKGLEFMGKIGEIAEQEGHHPDLHLVGWNKLSVEINTHSIGGLSQNDYILAAKISEVNAEDFLRKKKSLASS